MAYQGKKTDKSNSGNRSKDGRPDSARPTGAPKKYIKKSFGQEKSSFHKAICTKCNKSCEVPFKPTGTKPVLCKNCFQGKEEYSPNRKYEKKDFGKKPFSDRAPRPSNSITQDQFEILNAKLDKILGML